MSRWRFLLSAIFACSPTLLWAQDTGSITGIIEDPTRAVIAGVQIAVRDTAKGMIRTTISNGDGDYLLAGLPAGTYDIGFSAKGFQPREVKRVILAVAQKLRVDAVLQVGSAKTEFTVNGEQVPDVETETSGLSGVVTGREVSQLELNGRNFTQLITLVPGVGSVTGQDEGTVGPYGSVAYIVNGGRAEFNNWEIDGGDVLDNGSNSTLNVYPSIDAITEFRVLTSSYGAQYGRNGSGTVEVVTKSGTKQFHGDVFEFARNEAFNARNYFDGPSKPSYKRHDFGYTIGGPLSIPGHYNTKREKTFFFFSQEWRRERNPTAFDVPVPSKGERNGNFSDVCPVNAAAFTRAAFPDCPIIPGTGIPFPNNTVPVDPNGADLLALIPAPTTGSGSLSFFTESLSTPTTWREELLHIDQYFTSKLNASFRYIHDSWQTTTPAPPFFGGRFPTVQTHWVGPGTSVVVHLTYARSPSLLNEFVMSYTADQLTITPLGNWKRPSDMTMTGFFSNFGSKLPGIDVIGGIAYGGGFSEDVGGAPWNNANPTYTYRDVVTNKRGKHNLQFGAYAVTAQKNEQNYSDTQGFLTFNNSSAVSTGNAFADLLAGRIASFQQTNLQAKYYNRYKILETFLQDDWHLKPNLTLNLGLRISLFGTYRERYHQVFNFEPGAYDRATAPKVDVNGSVTGQVGALIPSSGNPFDGMVHCGVSGVPAGCMLGHLFNPAPRLGFAWDPLSNGKIAVRGGYGMFFEHTNGNESNTESLEGSPPLVLTPTESNVVGYTKIGGNGLLFPLSVTAIPTRIMWPYVQQWHFDIQREVLRKTIATISYVGSKGTHLTLQRNLNQIPALLPSQDLFAPGQPITPGAPSPDCGTSFNSLGVPTAAKTSTGTPITGQAAVNLAVAACGIDPDLLRPFQGYSNITLLEEQANSIYHSLQASLRRTIGKLSFSVAYTYGHSIDDASDRFDLALVDSYNPGASRASSMFDQRHILNFGYVYDLPVFGASGFTHSAFGGWQISGIGTVQTGTHFSIVNNVFNDNAGVANQGVGLGSYPDVAGDVNSSPPVANVAGIPGPLLYNPTMFIAPRGLTFGNAGRDILTNPRQTNFDVGLFKHFPVHDRMSIEFRIEAFNVLNHTEWNGVNSAVSCYGTNNSAGDPACVASSTFLHPTGAHRARTMQFGLKVLF
jgi:hypothetical protein